MSYKGDSVDVVVIGAGHAGCEAALAASRMGHPTILFAISLDSVAMMPCNPNVGGTGKGHLVREIDALGGEMGKNIDKTYIQSRMLNSSKGPAVHSLRAQADKKRYSMEMKKTIENEPNLKLKQGEIKELIVEDKVVKGVITTTDMEYRSKTVIIATGTYLKAFCITEHGNAFSWRYFDKLKKEFRLEKVRSILKKYDITIENVNVNLSGNGFGTPNPLPCAAAGLYGSIILTLIPIIPCLSSKCLTASCT